MNRSTVEKLIQKAFEARERAYVPYSGFKVGAAVLSGSGKIYGGCNIENASYGATICAERTAIAKALSEGETEILAVAVAGKRGAYTYPCGICRQVIIECGKEVEVIVAKSENEYKRFTIEALLPFGFTGEDMQ